MFEFFFVTVKRQANEGFEKSCSSLFLFYSLLYQLSYQAKLKSGENLRSHDARRSEWVLSKRSLSLGERASVLSSRVTFSPVTLFLYTRKLKLLHPMYFCLIFVFS